MVRTWYGQCFGVSTKRNLCFLLSKKRIFIYENWLIVAIIYHSSSVGNTRGALISCGEGGAGREFAIEKQLKVNNWWSCNK